MKRGILFADILLLANYINGIVLHSSADIANEILLLRQEVDAVKQENSVIKQENMQIKDNMKDTASAYVRWGKTVCATNGTTLVYKGYMAGHHYNDSTGGADFLCLPHDVQWAQYGISSSLDTRLYGAEYEMRTGTGHFNQDSVCCLCKTNRSTSVMIPARTTCFPGWTMEYTGYLAAGDRTKSLANYTAANF